MFLKTMGGLSTIQVRVWGFCTRGFVLGAFVLEGFCPRGVLSVPEMLICVPGIPLGLRQFLIFIET